MNDDVHETLANWREESAPISNLAPMTVGRLLVLLSAVEKVLALKPAHFGCDPEGQAWAEGHDLALRNAREAIQEALGGE